MNALVNVDVLRAAVLSADYGCIIIDASEQICFWNRWIAKYSGISEAEALGKRLSEVFSLTNDSVCCKAITQALTQGKSTLLSQTFHPNPLPLYRKSAKKTLMTQRVVVRSQTIGTDRFCFLEVTDQSAGSEREKYLAQTRDYISKIIESIQEMMLIMDTDYRLSEVNATTKSVLGYEENEMIGKSFFDFVLEPQKLEMWSADNPNLHRTKIKDVELNLRTQSGGSRTIILSGSFIENKDKLGLLFVAFAKDITGIREAERQLNDQKAQLATASKLSALGEMAGGIAHEINNPIAIIHGLSFQLKKKLLKANLDADKAITSILQEIESTTMRVSKIIKGLKAISRSGEKDDFFVASLKCIVEDTINLCGERFKTAGIILYVPEVADDLQIECRQVQVSQVLLNLLNNAKDAILGLDERWIRIEVTTQRDRVVIVVTDSGKGIDKVNQEKMFLPFFTTKGIGKGTGLGLSISKGIIEDHGGDFYYDAGQPNTTFVINLPLRQAAQKSA
jgi:PAS domain S-box-containing protein